MFKKLLFVATLLLMSLGTVSAATYKFEFYAWDTSDQSSTYFNLVSPGELLLDLTFDAEPGAGLVLDDVVLFRALIRSDFSMFDTIIGMNVYNWGGSSPQFDTAAAILGASTVYQGNFTDQRDCSTCTDGLDAGFFDIANIRLPNHLQPAGIITPPLLAFYSLGSDFSPDLGNDTLIINLDFGEIIRGDWKGGVISTGVIPIPAAIWLFGSALIGLIGFSKRSKVA